MTINQFAQNLVWASPATATGAPAMRSLVVADIPSLTSEYDVAGAAATAQTNAEAYAAALPFVSYGSAQSLTSGQQAQARSNIGLGSIATQSAGAVAITGGTATLASVTITNPTSGFVLNGSRFLYADASGNNGFGNSTLGSLTTGSNNFALGVGSLNAVTSGTINVAIGLSSSSALTTGSNNISVGSNALSANVSGGDNITMGLGGLEGVTSGSKNIGIGTIAGYNITTGSSNICIGYEQAVASATASGQIVIGGLFFGTGATATGGGNAGKAGILTNSPRVQLDVAGAIATNTTTVSGLPTAASVSGARWMVTDSTVAASGNFGAIVAGGGSNIAPVWCDGTNWRIG